MASEQVKRSFLSSDKYKEFATPKGLYKYPHVVKQMELFWGTDLFCDYMNNIIVQEKNKNREGFPSSVLNCLQTTIELHGKFWPQFNKPLENQLYLV